MYEGWSYEKLQVEAATLRMSMIEIDTRLSARGRNDRGELVKDPREYEQWRQRAVYAKQTKTLQYQEVKHRLASMAPPGAGQGRRFWREMCRSMIRVTEAVRSCETAPPELRQQAEGALSDLALALAAVPEGDDEITS